MSSLVHLGAARAPVASTEESNSFPSLTFTAAGMSPPEKTPCSPTRRQVAEAFERRLTIDTR